MTKKTTPTDTEYFRQMFFSSYSWIPTLYMSPVIAQSNIVKTIYINQIFILGITINLTLLSKSFHQPTFGASAP